MSNNFNNTVNKNENVLIEFKGYYQNVRGLRTKLNTLHYNILHLNFDYFGLVETGLHSDIIDSEMGFDDFTIYRVDRNPVISKCNRGGGVAVCIRKKYQTSRIPIVIDTIRHLFVQVKFNATDKLVIGICYIPPASPPYYYNDHVKAIEQIFSTVGENTRLILLGDYNLPKTNFYSDQSGFTYKGTFSDKSEILLNNFSFFGFYQHNMFFKKFGSQLDLIFSNNINTIVKLSETSLVLLDDFHPALTISSIVKKPSSIDAVVN